MSKESNSDLVQRVFAESRLPLGLCLGSKSGYAQMNPRNCFVPNANVYSAEAKLWWGDLDIRVHASALEEIARRVDCRLYVVREHDGRFERAKRPVEEVLADAIWHTGGKRLVRWTNYWADSGLSRRQFAEVSLFPRRLFTTPVAPECALQWERRLTMLRNLSRQLGTALGYDEWGTWWIRQPSCGGPSPLDHLNEARRTKGKFKCQIPAGTEVWEWDFHIAWRSIQRRYPW